MDLFNRNLSCSSIKTEILCSLITEIQHMGQSNIKYGQSALSSTTKIVGNFQSVTSCNQEDINIPTLDK